MVKLRTDSLLVRGLLHAAVLSLLGVVLIGVVTFFVSHNLLAVAVGQLSGQDMTALSPATYDEAIRRPALRTTALVSGVAASAAALLIAGWASSTSRILKRMAVLQRYLAKVGREDFVPLIAVSGHDELSDLARSLNGAVSASRERCADIEARMTESCAVLERRLRTYEVVRRVASVTSAFDSTQELSYAVVALVAESLGVDHVGLYLVDETTHRPSLSAVSAVGTQDTLVRQQMLRRNQDLVNRASATGETQVTRDAGVSFADLGVSQLQQIRFELALPLRAHDHIVGVLDLQSVRADILTDDDVTALSLLAGQLALSIDNVRLTEQRREVVETYRRRYADKTAQEWARSTGDTMAFHFSGLGVTPRESLVVKALPERAEIVERSDGFRELRAPIVVGDRVLGAVAFRQPMQAHPWGEEDVSFVAAVCGQVGQALERARLLDEAQAREAWQLRKDTLTERIWMSSTDVNRVLETTIRELGTELSAQGTIRLRALSNWRIDMDAPDAPFPDTEPADA